MAGSAAVVVASEGTKQCARKRHSDAMEDGTPDNSTTAKTTKRVRKKCEHGIPTVNCVVCSGCQHGKAKKNCNLCSGCPHGQRKQLCLVCSGCLHGKVKSSCVICSGCPHGKIKRDCDVCYGCTHGKVKRRCGLCSGCQHGKMKQICDVCSECLHGIAKMKCGLCSGCPHGKRKQICLVCSGCLHGKVKMCCGLCSGCQHEKLKQDCDVCSECTHGKLKKLCRECNVAHPYHGVADHHGRASDFEHVMTEALLEVLPSWTTTTEQFRIHNPFGKRALRVDIVVKLSQDCSFAVEFDGADHYPDGVRTFLTDPVLQLRRDRYVEQWCLEHKMSCFRVPYTCRTEAKRRKAVEYVIAAAKRNYEDSIVQVHYLDYQATYADIDKFAVHTDGVEFIHPTPYVNGVYVRA